jgi:DNA invertase Pin-like site-specific DNA recombinase
MKCLTYLRTSGDDGKGKAGLPVQRAACMAFAQKNGCEIIAEYSDDGVTGKLPMYARPQGKLLIPALLADGIKAVLCYDAKRIGRTQPSFWIFIGLCRDGGITVLDASGTDLTNSVMGGVNGMLAKMNRDATIARLQAGKAFWRGKKRVEGRHPYGEHPNYEVGVQHKYPATTQYL